MKKMMDDKDLLHLALEPERALTPEESELVAASPELALLRRDAAEFTAFAPARAEVPPILSHQIRAAARRQLTLGAKRRARRRLIPFAAAAALLLLGFGAFLLHTAPWQKEEPAFARGTDPSILSLADWSKLDQETYNLSFELSSSQYAVSDAELFGDLL